MSWYTHGRGCFFLRQSCSGSNPKYFPDFRRTLNELQRYASTGSIDTGILATLGDAKIDTLCESMKAKKFNDVKAWVTQNLDSDPASIMRNLYDNLTGIMDGPSTAAAVLIIADYQYEICIRSRSRSKSSCLSYSTYDGV